MEKRRSKFFSFLCFMLIFVSACSQDKSLTCSIKDASYSFEYDTDTLKKITIKHKVKDTKNMSSKALKTIYDNMQLTYDKLGGIDFSYTQTKGGIHTTLIINLSLADINEIITYQLLPIEQISDFNVEYLKNHFASNGYTCK